MASQVRPHGVGADIQVTKRGLLFEQMRAEGQAPYIGSGLANPGASYCLPKDDAGHPYSLLRLTRTKKSENAQSKSML